MTLTFNIDAIIGNLMASLTGLEDRPSIMRGIGQCLSAHLPLNAVYILCLSPQKDTILLFNLSTETILSQHNITLPLFNHFQDPIAPTPIQKLPKTIQATLDDFSFLPSDFIYPVHSFGVLQGLFVLQPHTPLSAEDHVLLFTIMHHILILFDQLSYKSHISQLQSALDDATKAASVFWLINDYMHDLKTHWGLLQTAVDPLSGCVTPDDFRERILKYSDRAYKTLATINRILARDRARVAVHIDLSKAVRDVLNAHSDMKVVQFYAPKMHPFIIGDPSDIDILIINLIKNAKEAIRTDSLKKHDIFVSIGYMPEEKKVFLSVKDMGCGMGPEAVEAILSGHAYSTKCFGSGVGTRAILRIVKDHHATMTLQSTLGEGSVFTILFPPA